MKSRLDIISARATFPSSYSSGNCISAIGLEDIVLSILSAPEGPRSTGMADTEGWLPLHCAVYYQHLGIVRYLVQVGINELN